MGIGGLLFPEGKAFIGSLLKLGSVAAIAGGLSVLALLTVGVLSNELRETGRAHIECVVSEAAVNSTGARGEENLRQAFLSTIEEAEAFLCVHLPRVELPETWQPRQVMTAVRSNYIGEYDAGEWSAGEDAYKFVEIYFGDFERSIWVTLMVSPSDLPQRWPTGPVCGAAVSDSAVEAADVIIQGARSTLWTEPNRAGWSTITSSVCWERADLTFFAVINSPPSIDVQSEVLPILGSMK